MFSTKAEEQAWEDICDGCGKCCQLNGCSGDGIACPSLDTTTNHCTNYKNRLELEICLKVFPDNVLDLHRKKILPDSCGYVRHMQGKAPLPRPVGPARLVPFLVSGLKFQKGYNEARKQWFILKAVNDPKGSKK